MKFFKIIKNSRSSAHLQWFGIALFVALAIPAIIHTAHKLNFAQIDRSARQSASTVLHEIGERVGVVDTMLASLEGLYYVSPELDKGKLKYFSRELLINSPYITTLGRYESVSRGQRSEFEFRMSNSGHPGIKISEIGEDGSINPRGARSQYFPIALMEPLKPENLAMIGVDFGSVSGLAQTLQMIAENDISVIAPLPEAWPGTADLVAFKPVYRGKETPASADDRLQQTTGGFWLNIDMQRLLDGVSELVNEFNVDVEIIEDQNRTSVLTSRITEPEPYYFQSLYDPQRFSRVWNFGASGSLLIRLEKPVGLSAQTVSLAILAVLATVFIGCLLAFYLRSEQQRASKIREDQRLRLLEQQKTEKTFDSVNDAIIMLDDTHRVVRINPAAATLLNTKPRFCEGHTLSTVMQFHSLDDRLSLFDIEQALQQVNDDGKHEVDLVPVGYTDDSFVIRMSMSASTSDDGKITGHLVVLRDVSHERRNQKKLAYQANYDALTGCSNRYYFEQHLEKLIDSVRASGITHSLCYIDLDQFRAVNDICGQRAGDQLLIELTRKLNDMLRPQDLLSRVGGHEFGLLMSDVSVKEANQICGRFYDFFQNFIFSYEENTFAVTASIGVVHIDSTYTNVQDVLEAANTACYSGKDRGRSSMFVYSKDEQSKKDNRKLNWLPQLQTALSNDQFRLHMQPMVALSGSSSGDLTRTITHFEFLLRLADSEGNEITPWRVIEAAERYNLMGEIDRWVIHNALRTIAALQSGPEAACTYSINLSGQSAADPDLAKYIESQMQQLHVEPSRVWFELTETAAISNFSVAVELMKKIRELGCKIALDDFGSGLSSFGYLRNLPVDVVKIDGQFIREITSSAVEREMVRAIQRVGESLNIVAVAEFVEDHETLVELAKLGVQYAQGFHVGKPERIQDAIAQLSTQAKAA